MELVRVMGLSQAYLSAKLRRSTANILFYNSIYVFASHVPRGRRRAKSIFYKDGAVENGKQTPAMQSECVSSFDQNLQYGKLGTGFINQNESYKLRQDYTRLSEMYYQS